MMEQQRQQAQLDFVSSGQNITVGTLDDLPVSLEQLKATTPQSDYVVDTFNSGLTAVVYHLRIGGTDWTLKQKREVSLVKNIDGQTSFLNEVQRRRDITQLKQRDPDSFKHIVDTQFASYQDGIILSPWIKGELLHTLSADVFSQIFSAIVSLELNGLFEWDFCPGNILLGPQGEVKLFDFGYMYQFNPLQHFNSNGRATPLFHGIERFETRFLFDYFLKNPTNLSAKAQFELYRVEKQCALSAYQHKLQQLSALEPAQAVIEHLEGLTRRWQRALDNDDALHELYLIESYRSSLLDLLDDLHGQSCSVYTLKKADWVLELVECHFEKLKANEAFFFGDETLEKGELVAKLSRLRKDAEKYQLGKLQEAVN
ncbi:hypothetical protein BIT28_27580 [Photobacterium proteolyticum]|uniref:Protein kinase domain-containing protein n=1 Tax=Photobacterium proteolyticum TaxID=1903952 RepID=A0A1Q9H116_9GAMM|nr:hypothetical protein [Photobacterium proteolyticum]OLQ81363.1 hypothetical protein BIT28_27580 [Photobacterium proteolyticum]